MRQTETSRRSIGIYQQASHGATGPSKKESAGYKVRQSPPEESMPGPSEPAHGDHLRTWTRGQMASRAVPRSAETGARSHEDGTEEDVRRATCAPSCLRRSKSHSAAH